MPRLPTSLVLKAYRQNHLLPLLLQECRSLDLARNELRWLRERALLVGKSVSSKQGGLQNPRPGWRTLLRSMCRTRSKGVPLQYILGDQPFGDLEILCRKGVLIPRSDTESYTVHAADLILKDLRQRGSSGGLNPTSKERPLSIIDLCTGTGCISLLLHSLLASHFQQLSIVGIDISATAIQLARRNQEHNVRLGLLSERAMTEVHFHQADVLSRGSSGIPNVEEVLSELGSHDLKQKLSQRDGLGCDVLISNPPYISATSFRDGTTSRSVRGFEPVLALVPPADIKSSTPENCREEDIFYHHIVALSSRLRAMLVVLECGDLKQARHVAAMCNTATRPGTVDKQAHIWPDPKSYEGVGASELESQPYAVILQMQRAPIVDKDLQAL